MATDNEVVIHVRAEDETATVFDAVRAKAKKLGDDVSVKIKAEDNTKAAFDSAERRAKELDDDVNIEIKASDGTGDAFDKVKEKVKETGEQFTRTSTQAGQSMADGMADGIRKAQPQVIAAAAAIGVLMAPQIGATIGGAIIGGAGLGGVAGGLLVAAQDSRVKVASRNLGETVSTGLKGAATTFVPATVEAIDKVKAAWKTTLPTIKSIFEQSAEFVVPLTDSLTTAGARLLEGIDHAISQAGPVMDAFGYLFEEVGDSVADAFEMMATEADGGASAIQTLGEWVGDAVRKFGALVMILSEVKGWLDSVGDGIGSVRNFLEDHAGWLDLTNDGYEAGTEAARLYREGVIGAANSSNDYNNYLQEQAGGQAAAAEAAERHTEALQVLADEMRRQTDPLFNIFDLQAKVVKAQEDYNKALNEGGPESAKAQKALLAMGRAAFELNTALGEAADGFDGHLTPAMRTALRNAGMTEDEMNELEKALIRARGAAEKWEGSFEQVFITKEVYKRSDGSWGSTKAGGSRDPGNAHGGIKGAASGMTTGGLTWVGEQGPELLRLPPGSQVHSNPDSQRMASGMSGGAAASGPVVINLMVDDATIAYAILPSLQALNRTDFGGDVTRMFPATR